MEGVSKVLTSHNYIEDLSNSQIDVKKDGDTMPTIRDMSIAT
jgi:hypothetical protein